MSMANAITPEADLISNKEFESRDKCRWDSRRLCDALLSPESVVRSAINLHWSANLFGPLAYNSHSHDPNGFTLINLRVRPSP